MGERAARREPLPGATTWRVFELPGDASVAQYLKAQNVSKRGDCVVQRGTNHAWRNKSGRPVRMAVVMLGLAAE